VRVCEGCGNKAFAFRPRKRIKGKLLCDACVAGRPGRPTAQASRHGISTGTSSNVFYTNIHVAHDSGDGATINHCFNCGSGNVVGRSDGTAECLYCHQHFTVQIQPEFPAMPQTVDGEPIEIPGMPGSQDLSANPEKKAPAKAPAKKKPDDAKAKKPDDAKKKPDDATTKKASRHYLTYSGVLNEESFIRHLAIKHADAPAEVIKQIRAERTR